MPYADLALYLIFGPIVLLAVIYTLRAGIGYARLDKDAREDFAFRQSRGVRALTGVGEDLYVAAWRRTHAPRGPAHTAAALWTMLLATPIIAKGLEIGLDLIWQLSGRSRVVEPGYLVWQFFIFFFLIAAWAGIAYLFARRYHARVPGRLDDELAVLAGAAETSSSF